MSLVKLIKYKVNNRLSIEVNNLSLAAGAITGLIGPSGCGKTTLMNIMLGLVPGATLSWELNNKEMGQLDVRSRRLGVVFQNYDLFPMLTVKENIEFAAKARGVAKEVFRSNLDKFANKLNLKSILNQKAQSLSGGEQQRVALARALMGEPDFLFLDEAFSSLDPGLRKDSRQLVKEVLAEYNISCLMITHDIEDIKALASKVYQMKEGKVIDSNLKIS